MALPRFSLSPGVTGNWAPSLSVDRTESYYCATGVAVNPVFTFQIAQVSDGLTGGKPLLGNGEIFPSFTVDIPGHARGDFISVHRLVAQHVHDFIGPVAVMCFQLLDSAFQISQKVSVSGQNHIHIQVINLVQAGDVVSQ